MKKAITVILAIIIIGISVVLFVNQPNRTIKKTKDRKYQKIMEQDFKYDYPETYTDVVKKYCEIEQLIYNTKYEGKQAERFETLAKKQLELVDRELIDFNGGEEKIILSTREDAKKFFEGKYKIMNIEYQAVSNSTLDKDNNLIKCVDVIEYISLGDNVYKRYALRKDRDKRWKIVSFINIDPFKIS